MKTRRLIMCFVLSSILLCGCVQRDTGAAVDLATSSASDSAAGLITTSPDTADSTDGYETAPVNQLESPAVTSMASGKLLTMDDLIDISVSAPEGSGALRTLTIHYRQDGEERYNTIGEVSRIGLEGYDDEKMEQTFTVSDRDRDGIVDIVVYREFWFSDLDLAHAQIPLWPTIYEYDLEGGFVVASAKHKDYFASYIAVSEEQLAEGKIYMGGDEMLALSRLIYAAERIADGSFVPESPYNGDNYYEDVYELTKDISEYQ